MSSVSASSIYNNIRAESSSGERGDASVNVNVQNNINTESSNYSSKFKTRTKVDIQQEGNGKSSITINGKEWKLDGPGEIYVDENSESSELTPTVTLNPEESPTPDVLSVQDEVKLTFTQKIKVGFTNIKMSVFGFFTKITNIFKYFCRKIKNSLRLSAIRSLRVNRRLQVISLLWLNS